MDRDDVAVGFVGLGIMGGRMAANLQKAGYKLVVHDLQIQAAIAGLVAASELARELGQRPAGLLRLTVPRAVVPILLEPLIASFCQASRRPGGDRREREYGRYRCRRI